jgi:SH3-like domain-containing protein
MTWRRATLALLLALGAAGAQAIEFRSINVNAAILYDAPSAQARKVTLLSRYYPVEVVVALEKWMKVRDATGALAWVEIQNLSDKRTVLVRASMAEVRQSPSASAPVAFKAEQDVALELVEFSSGPWIKVKHRDGQTGYLEATQVWGL